MAKTLRVGFLEDATYPNGTRVALVAAVQNFGAPSRGILPRPFFSNAVDDGGKRWGKLLAKILPTTGFDAKRSLELLGEEVKGDIRQSIIDTNEPPLKEATIERKGFDKPLIHTSHMINSVDDEVV